MHPDVRRALGGRVPRDTTGLELVRSRLDRASMRDALDDPEPFAPRQARVAGQHANSRSKQSVRLLQQSGCHHNANWTSYLHNPQRQVRHLNCDLAKI